MASISLRAYNSEIESMIEHEQSEEAVAHCMHILQYVPKHIATYRLLGKALLELQRYTDATDIFNRVLSSVPDDFVSHVGMSIIRENENNLDGAIWHMERAYEAQPANAAIQDELRRLYGRRDGMEPPKIRLTRGALARMYAKGQLYQQAIGELQAALSEDDRRPDLQVQLALMYYLSGQREQSIRVCSDLLKKLPYCLEANRILADLLPETTTSGIQSYQQRLISLDPYYGHIKPDSPTSDRVPANAVVVERLEYQPGQYQLTREVEQPDWAVSLGTPIETEEEESLPDWFTTESEDEKDIAAAEEDEKIPDFLKEAGWTESDRSADEIAMEELQKEQDDLINEAIEPAEIPDWLLEIAPEEALEENQLQDNVQVPDEEILPWLQDSEPGPTDSVMTWLEETKDTVSEQEIKDLESALQEASTEVEGLDTSWLSGEETEESEEPAEIKEEAELETAVSEEQMPEWPAGEEEIVLAEASQETEIEGELQTSEELPDWLKGFEEETDIEAEELPDWLKEAEGSIEEREALDFREEETAPELEPEEPAIESEQTAVWQQTVESPPEAEAQAEEPWSIEEELATVQGVEGIPEPILEPEERTDDITRWLESLDDEDAMEEIEASSDLPDWFVEEAEEVSPLDDTQPMRIVPEVVETAAVEEKAEQEPVEREEESLGEEALGEGEGVLEEEGPLMVEPAEMAVTAGPSELDLEDPEAALAWLESLAAQQGADADQLTTRPEDRPETPEWILASAAEAEASGEVPTYEPTETTEGFEEPAVLPEEPVEEEAIGGAELPMEEQVEAALEELAIEGEVEEPVLEEIELEEPAIDILAAAETPVDEVEAEELVLEELAGETVEELPFETEELPEWMVGSLEAPAETVSEEILIPAAEEEPGLPDWLKEEEEEGVLEDTQPTILAEEPEPTPDWMLESEMAEQSTLKEPTAEEEEIPDWLREVTAESEALAEEIAAPEPVEEIIPEQIEEPQVEMEEPELTTEPVEAEMETQISIQPREKVNLNTAPLSALEKLPGIGFILAQSILNYREANGPFDRIEDLQEVPGIDSSLIEEIRDKVDVIVEPSVPIEEEPEPEVLLEDEEVLMTARQALLKGEFKAAVDLTTQLVQQNLFLDEIIQDLQDALYRNSSETVLWEALGDAYVRNDQLQEALDAYLHAEELLG